MVDISCEAGSAGDVPAVNDDVVIFDRYVLDLENRTLFQDGQPIHARQRELDILIYFARRPNRIITKDELIDGIWQGQAVSDANVRVQMSALRRLLGEGRDRPAFIDFLPRQGYRFCPPGSRQDTSNRDPAPVVRNDPPSPDTRAATQRHNLPIRLKPAFGREHDRNHLLALLAENRLATITGPGGIGKTTLALAAAEILVEAFEDGVRFVDLAGLGDADLVAGTLAATLGMAIGPGAGDDGLVSHLVTKQMLFVVDNCEHLIGPVAALVESILRQTRHIRVLCTSREPLRIDGEWLVRLGPLELPPRANNVSASQAAEYPAVRLFNHRASLGLDTFCPDDDQILTVAELCRRLDGNPLAIELAAARLGLFGLNGLAAQFEESLGLTVQGRRTAVPRHKTLRATIDWSYNLLPAVERRVLGRLSVFRGDFALGAVKAVAGEGIDDDNLMDSLAELVAKSLIGVDHARGAPTYRMLFLTRDFAFEKLIESGEHNRIALRHAEYFLGLMNALSSERQADAEAWVADVGAAIDWSLGEPGEPELGCQLIRASFNVMARFSRQADRRGLVDRALKRIGNAQETETVTKLSLYIERMHNLQFTAGDETELHRWATDTYDLAERIYAKTGDVTTRLEMYAMRCSLVFSLSNGPELLRLATGADSLPGMPAMSGHSKLIMERFTFQAHHLCGQHDQALHYISKVLSYPDEMLSTRVFFIADHMNPAVTARIFKARTLWIQGHPAQASETAAEALARAFSDRPNVLCYALAFAAIPVALWRGDDAEAARVLGLLEVTAEQQGLQYWLSWCDLYASVLAWRLAGAPEGAAPALPCYNAYHIDHAATFWPAEHPKALRRVEAGLVGWNSPEVLRRSAEWKRANRVALDPEMEALLEKAMDLAGRQGALGWMLRSALSLGRLRRDQGRFHDALTTLQGIAGRFDSALPDSDIVAAKTLITELEREVAS